MKHFILAAGLMLIAAPAFAGSVHDLNAPQSNKSDTNAVTFTDTQIGGTKSDSAIEQRNDNLRRAAEGRSNNARAAWQGSVHYY